MTSTLEDIDVIPREEFVHEFGRAYGHGNKWGGHVTFIGPTQRGKTRLSHELLNKIITPEYNCIMLAGKPPGRDATMADAEKRLNLRLIEDWPPTMAVVRDRKKRGYIVRPYYDIKMDIERAEQRLHDVFHDAMVAAYTSSKPVILDVDEAHQVQNDLHLKREYEAPLMRGAPVCAVWSLIQRGRYITYHAYNAPEHIFIFQDPDKSNRERYSDIGGVDPRAIAYITENLRTYTTEKGNSISEALYIRRAGPQLAIVGVK